MSSIFLAAFAPISLTFPAPARPSTCTSASFVKSLKNALYIPPEVCSPLVYSHSGALTDMNECPRNQHILSALSDMKFGGLLLMASIFNLHLWLLCCLSSISRHCHGYWGRCSLPLICSWCRGPLWCRRQWWWCPSSCFGSSSCCRRQLCCWQRHHPSSFGPCSCWRRWQHGVKKWRTSFVLIVDSCVKIIIKFRRKLDNRKIVV